jgi:hydrogenase maturation protease
LTIQDRRCLVLGVGNVLLRDEGVGVRVIEELERLPAGALPDPGRVRLVDGGTLGLDLLPLIEDSSALILVDAVNLRREPGTVGVIRGDDLHSTLAGHVSPHQVGVGDLVAAARLSGVIPPYVSLVAIQPEAIEIGLDLTAAVEAALPRAVAATLDEIASAEAATTAAPGPDAAIDAVPA